MRSFNVVIALLALGGQVYADDCYNYRLFTNPQPAGFAATCKQYQNMTNEGKNPVSECMDSSKVEGLPKNVQCATCVIGLTKCVASSNCTYDDYWCGRYMSDIGCEPVWCSSKSSGTVATAYYTYSARKNASVIVQNVVDQVQSLEAAWVKAEVVRMSTISANVWKVTATIPKGKAGIPTFYGELTTQLNRLQDNRDFLQQTAINGVYAEKSCANVIYNDSEANDNTCSSYGGLETPPESLMERLESKVQSLIDKGVSMRNSSRCLSYAGLASCVAASGCHQGVSWCNLTMKNVGCNESWCTAKPKPAGEVRRVVAKYTLSKSVTANFFLSKLGEYLDSFVFSWTTVTIYNYTNVVSTLAPVTSEARDAIVLADNFYASVKVTIPEGQITTSDFLTAVKEQLEDAGNSEEFRAATGSSNITASVEVIIPTPIPTTDDGLTQGGIAGIIIGGGFFFCIVVVGIIYLCFYKEEDNTFPDSVEKSA